ncbi:MAG: hypothetical protein GY871_04525 [Actinomycetales bacterium]|nr:hypothetical protein [Actinomycetales bacterium]
MSEPKPAPHHHRPWAEPLENYGFPLHTESVVEWVYEALLRLREYDIAPTELELEQVWKRLRGEA